MIAYVTVIKRQGVASKTINAEKRKYDNKITKKNDSLKLESSTNSLMHYDLKINVKNYSLYTC